MAYLIPYLPPGGSTAGAYIASKLLQLVGKRALRAEWKKVLRELAEDRSIPEEERKKLAALLERPVVKSISSGSGEELEKILKKAEISDEIAQIILNHIQAFFLGLAKNNTLFFYDFMVDAAKENMDGIEEIKKALGIGKLALDESSKEENINRIKRYLESQENRIIQQIGAWHAEVIADTQAILVKQEDILTILNELKDDIERIGNTGKNKGIEGWYAENGITAEEKALSHIYHFLSKISSGAGRERPEDVAKGMFNSAAVFFNLYRLTYGIHYYRIGVRCYLLGKTFIKHEKRKR